MQIWKGYFCHQHAAPAGAHHRVRNATNRRGKSASILDTFVIGYSKLL